MTTPLRTNVLDSIRNNRVLQFRFKREYSGEENLWGVVEAYKRLTGIITFVQCQVTDNLQPAVEDFTSLLVRPS